WSAPPGPSGPQRPAALPAPFHVLQSLMPVFHDFPALNSAKLGRGAPHTGGASTQSETPAGKFPAGVFTLIAPASGGGDRQLQAQPSLAYQPQRSRWSAP